MDQFVDLKSLNLLAFQTAFAIAVLCCFEGNLVVGWLCSRPMCVCVLVRVSRTWRRSQPKPITHINNPFLHHSPDKNDDEMIFHHDDENTRRRELNLYAETFHT